MSKDRQGAVGGPLRTARFSDLRAVYEGWTRLFRVKMQLPGGVHEVHIEDHGEAVAVLPYDPVRRTVMLIRQPRAPMWFAGAQDVLEAIAGRNDGEAPAECARREALEEAGLQLDTLEHVGCIWMMPSLSTERIDYFLAPYSAACVVHAGGGLEAEGEQIATIELGLDDLSMFGGSVVVEEAKALLLVQALALRYPELVRHV